MRRSKKRNGKQDEKTVRLFEEVATLLTFLRREGILDVHVKCNFQAYRLQLKVSYGLFDRDIWTSIER